MRLYVTLTGTRMLTKCGSTSPLLATEHHSSSSRPSNADTLTLRYGLWLPPSNKSWTQRQKLTGGYWSQSKVSDSTPTPKPAHYVRVIFYYLWPYACSYYIYLDCFYLILCYTNGNSAGHCLLMTYTPGERNEISTPLQNYPRPHHLCGWGVCLIWYVLFVCTVLANRVMDVGQLTTKSLASAGLFILCIKANMIYKNRAPKGCAVLFWTKKFT